MELYDLTISVVGTQDGHETVIRQAVQNIPMSDVVPAGYRMVDELMGDITEMRPVLGVNIDFVIAEDYD